MKSKFSFLLIILFSLVLFSQIVVAVPDVPLGGYTLDAWASKFARQYTTVQNGVITHVKALNGATYPYNSPAGEKALGEILEHAKAQYGALNVADAGKGVNITAGNNARIINQVGSGNTVTDSQNVVTKTTRAAAAKKPVTPKPRPVPKPVVDPNYPKPVPNPVDPIKPVPKPVDPIKPVDPVVDPVKPVDPVVDPVKPVDPVVDPVKPVDPIEPTPKFQLSKYVNGWTIAAILGGVDDLIVSRSNIGFDIENIEIERDSWGTSVVEYASGGIGALSKYGIGRLLFGTVGRVFSKKAAETAVVAVGSTSVSAAKLTSAGVLNAVLLGFTSGGVAGEYYMMDKVIGEVNASVKKLENVFFAGAGYTDSEKTHIGTFSKNVTGTNGKLNRFDNIDDIENSQINFILNNDLFFLNKILPADPVNGVLPVFETSDNKIFLRVSNHRSNLSKVYATMLITKMLFEEPEKAGEMSGWDSFLYGFVRVADEASFGFSSMRRRSFIHSIDNLDKLFKESPPVGSGSISVLSTNSLKPIAVERGYACAANTAFNKQVIDCQFNKNLPEGVYIIDYRQNYGIPTYLSIGKLYENELKNGFENFFESTNCGLSTELPENSKSKSFFCASALGEMYDLEKDEFTEKGKNDVKKYLDFVEEYYDFLTFEPTIGFNFLNKVYPEEDLIFIKKLIDSKDNYEDLKNYKYFLATALYGYPTYSVVAMGDPNTIFDSFIDGEIVQQILADMPLDYYLKIINQRVVGIRSK
ncbi:MAG: hypothetical protein PHX27_03255 [Candidatus ainarchaeum sp.]|nr:hypothetical protein [Candidatus ainarchaeum sp.]